MSVDLAQIERITIAPDSEVSEAVVFEIAQLRTTTGYTYSNGLSSYDEVNVEQQLLDYGLAPDWVLFGSNEGFGQGTDTSGYATGSFEVLPGGGIPQFGITTSVDNGGSGNSVDLYDASNNGGELIFSMRVVNGAIGNYEIRLDAQDDSFAVQSMSQNLDGHMPTNDWQEFRFDLGNFMSVDLSQIERITIAPDSEVSEAVVYEIAQLRTTTGYTYSNNVTYLANMAPFDYTGAEVNGEQFIIRDHANYWGGFANVNSDITDLSFPLGGEVNFDAALPSSDSLQTTVYFKFEYQPFPMVNPYFTTEKVIISNTDMQSFSITIPPQDASNTYSSFLLYIEELEQPVVIQNIQVVVY